MPTVTCICGSEILVVPDLKAMNIAIQKHVAEHRKPDDGSERILALGSLEQFLIEGVLRVASELNLPNPNGRDLAHRAVNRKPKFPKGTKSQHCKT